jgi:multicomponent Na+:H+ antiporter subunit E
MKATFGVAHDLPTLRHHIRPGVIASPLDLATDLEILVVTTFITITPGTVKLNVPSVKRTLFEHALYQEDSP